MNDLNRALGDIRDIRRQVAQSTEFRGYGPLTLFTTAIFAAVAGLAQSVWVPEPARHPLQYVAIWSITAIFSAALIAVQTLTRTHRMHSGMANEMILMAVEQFLPAAAAGTLLTVVIASTVPQLVWLLPGLWQVVYSLGVFSSCRFMPRPMLAAGAWYLLTGLLCISLGDARALSPWVMAGAYAVGQSIIAGILYFAAKEASHEE
ncbi:MAG TPA: hypothetical protein VGG18_02025 [Granulicella sp.]